VVRLLLIEDGSVVLSAIEVLDELAMMANLGECSGARRLLGAGLREEVAR
jgi:hypothetical protein